VVRQRLTELPPPAPWSSVVLDSEGLWAVARNDNDDAQAVVTASMVAGVPVLVPAAILAETLHGDARDARANQVLKKLQIVDLTDPIARLAAQLKLRASMVGVRATIDAVVVAVSAMAGGGVIVTSDVEDIRRLAGTSGVRIRTVQV
jgi:predicted nucleic acid-binding protein